MLKHLQLKCKFYLHAICLKHHEYFIRRRTHLLEIKPPLQATSWLNLHLSGGSLVTQTVLGGKTAVESEILSDPRLDLNGEEPTKVQISIVEGEVPAKLSPLAHKLQNAAIQKVASEVGNTPF